MNPGPTPSPHPLATLRRFVRPRTTSAKQCELCSGVLGEEHDHLVEPAAHRLLCCCTACGLLFSGASSSKYRRVPRRIEKLSGFRLTDAQWDGLLIPIDLAYFFHSTPASRVVAFYPSPAGAMESLLSLEAWDVLRGENPILDQLQPDVEALLVNRVGQRREYHRVPIDECYRLVGLIRSHWRGLSGGSVVWDEIHRFFEQLQARAG